MSFISRYTSKLLKNEFSKNFLTLFTGSVFSQVIPLLGSIILTRIYSPTDFSTLAIFLSIVSVISIISTGRYEFAIVIPKKDKDAVNIAFSSLCLVVIISLITLFFVFIFNNRIGVWLESEELNKLLYLIPISVFLNGTYQIVLYWLNRRKNFSRIAKSRIINNGSNTSLSIILGFFKKANGMITGTIFSMLIVLLVNLRDIFKEDKKSFREISLAKSRYVIKKYKNFPLVNAVHALVNTAKESYINIFISISYASTQLGFYYLVIRMMKMPVSLIGSSISQVLLSQASELYNEKKDISKIIKKIIFNLFFAGLGPIMILFFLGEVIFSFVFGKEWAIAGEMAAAISPYILFHFIASPLGSIPLILNQQGKAFIFGMIESILFVICFLFGKWYFQDLVLSLYLLSGIMPVFFIIYFRWIYFISKNNNQINE